MGRSSISVKPNDVIWKTSAFRHSGSSLGPVVIMMLSETEPTIQEMWRCVLSVASGAFMSVPPSLVVTVKEKGLSVLILHSFLVQIVLKSCQQGHHCWLVRLQGSAVFQDGTFPLLFPLGWQAGLGSAFPHSLSWGHWDPLWIKVGRESVPVLCTLFSFFSSLIIWHCLDDSSFAFSSSCWLPIWFHAVHFILNHENVTARREGTARI